MTDKEISRRLLQFIKETFLAGDPKNELDTEAPLLEWGVLNSLNTAVLLSAIREEIGVPVPPVQINAQNFKDINSITAMILDLKYAGSER